MNKNLLNEFLTPAEVADMLKVSVSYLAKLRMEKYNKEKDGSIKENYLPFYRFSNKILYNKEDVCNWLNSKIIKD